MASFCFAADFLVTIELTVSGTHPVKATGEADVRTLMGSRRTHVQVSWCTIRGSGSCSDLRRRAPIPRQEIADPPVGVVG